MKISVLVGGKVLKISKSTRILRLDQGKREEGQKDGRVGTRTNPEPIGTNLSTH